MFSTVNAIKMTYGVFYINNLERQPDISINSSVGHIIYTNVKNINHDRNDVTLCHTVVMSNDGDYGGSLVKLYFTKYKRKSGDCLFPEDE